MNYKKKLGKKMSIISERRQKRQNDVFKLFLPHHHVKNITNGNTNINMNMNISDNQKVPIISTPSNLVVNITSFSPLSIQYKSPSDKNSVENSVVPLKHNVVGSHSYSLSTVNSSYNNYENDESKLKSSSLPPLSPPNFEYESKSSISSNPSLQLFSSLKTQPLPSLEILTKPTTIQSHSRITTNKMGQEDNKEKEEKEKEEEEKEQLKIDDAEMASWMKVQDECLDDNGVISIDLLSLECNPINENENENKYGNKNTIIKSLTYKFQWPTYSQGIYLKNHNTYFLNFDIAIKSYDNNNDNNGKQKIEKIIDEFKNVDRIISIDENNKIKSSTTGPIFKRINRSDGLTSSFDLNCNYYDPETFSLIPLITYYPSDQNLKSIICQVRIIIRQHR
jgi:hypothetical protein